MWPMDLLCLILIHTFYKIIRFYDMLFFCESQVIVRARVCFPGKLYFLCFYDRLAVVFFLFLTASSFHHVQTFIAICQCKLKIAIFFKSKVNVLEVISGQSFHGNSICVPQIYVSAIHVILMISS